MKNMFITPKELRNEQLRCIGLATRLEAGRCPVLSRLAIVVSCLALVAFIGWAATARVDDVTHAAGKIVPDSEHHMVQHPEGGTVQSVMVHEGQLVPQGAPLVVLGDKEVTSDLAHFKAEQAQLVLQQARLTAFINNRPFDTTPFTGMDKALVAGQKQLYAAMVQAQNAVHRDMLKQAAQKQAAIHTLEDQLATAKERVRILQDVYDRRQKLVNQGQMAPASLPDMQQKLAHATGDVAALSQQIDQAQNAADTLKTRLTAQIDASRDKAAHTLDQVRTALEQNTRTLAQAQARYDHLTVRAPVAGIVKGLAVGKAGEVVKPGESLMEIVPQHQPLFVALRIPLQRAGYVQAGDRVRVKVSAYNLTHYGTLPGVLVNVSPAAFAGADGALYAKGLVRLVPENAGKAPGAARADEVTPGMAAVADIVTGQQTLMGQLLRPARVLVAHAF